MMMDSCSAWNQFLPNNKVHKVTSSWSIRWSMNHHYIYVHLSERYIVWEISLASSVVMMITRNRSWLRIFNAGIDAETRMHNWKHARIPTITPRVGRVDMTCFRMFKGDMSAFCVYVLHLMKMCEVSWTLVTSLMCAGCAHMSWIDDDVLLFLHLNCDIVCEIRTQFAWGLAMM